MKFCCVNYNNYVEIVLFFFLKGSLIQFLMDLYEKVNLKLVFMFIYLLFVLSNLVQIWDFVSYEIYLIIIGE